MVTVLYFMADLFGSSCRSDPGTADTSGRWEHCKHKDLVKYSKEASLMELAS